MSAIKTFIVATRELNDIRKAHASTLKTCRETKAATQGQLHSLLQSSNASCVPVGDSLFARVKTNRSQRTITEPMVKEAIEGIPTGILLNSTLDDAVNTVTAAIQQARPVLRSFAALEKHPERGYKELEPQPLVLEAAEQYTAAAEKLKEARATLKAAIGNRPAELKRHERDVSDWLGSNTSQKVDLTIRAGGIGHATFPSKATFYVRKKETRRRPRITVDMMDEFIRKALGHARRTPDNVRDALAADVLRRLGAVASVASVRVTLDRSRKKTN